MSYDWLSYAGLAAVGLTSVYFLTRKSKKRKGPFKVVVTGSSKGVGLALAEEFAKNGCAVCIVARTQDRLEQAKQAIASEYKHCKLFSKSCDISSEADLDDLCKYLQEEMGGVDIWVSNAGCSSSKHDVLWETSSEEMESIVKTNVLGTLLSTKKAVQLMKTQPNGGQLFLMDGAGSSGGSTARYASYGYSKAGLPQLFQSIQKELKLDSDCEKVRINLLSPGMVYTSLLLGTEDSEKRKKWTKMTCFIFNALADHPQKVASWLVKKILSTVEYDLSGKYIKYLTTTSAICKALIYLLVGEKTISICPDSGPEILDPSIQKYL